MLSGLGITGKVQLLGYPQIRWSGTKERNGRFERKVPGLLSTVESGWSKSAKDRNASITRRPMVDPHAFLLHPFPPSFGK